MAGGPLKSIALMRGIGFVIGSPDRELFVQYVLGLPMLGWARHAPTMARRVHYPTDDVESFIREAPDRNTVLISRTKASRDAALDEAAWTKSLEEVDLGILSPPVYDLSDLPFLAPCLVRRRGIWEQHGLAIDVTVCVLDDLLEGGQNATVGYMQSHRPATLDNLSASIRSLGTRFRVPISGFASDFAKAFKHIPNCLAFLALSVVVQYDPRSKRPAFMVPMTQVVGGRSTQLNFAR